MMRAPAPEAILRLGGVDFTVGGLQSTSAFRAYINRTEYQDTLTGPHGADVNTTFAYLTHRVGTPQAPFPAEALWCLEQVTISRLVVLEELEIIENVYRS